MGEEAEITSLLEVMACPQRRIYGEFWNEIGDNEHTDAHLEKVRVS